MNDPNKQQPQRVSNPTPEQPPAPSEYEKNVPHAPEQPVAISKSAKGGEGSYEGTKQYQQGYEKFAKQTSPDDAVKTATEINPNDPSLKQAEQRGKSGRTSSPSIH